LLLVQSFKRPQSNVLRLHPVGNTRQSRAQKGYVNKHNRRTEDRTQQTYILLLNKEKINT
jgi:hypothetical protein